MSNFILPPKFIAIKTEFFMSIYSVICYSFSLKWTELYRRKCKLRCLFFLFRTWRDGYTIRKDDDYYMDLIKY
jgi:hypothetical protein